MFAIATRSAIHAQQLHDRVGPGYQLLSPAATAPTAAQPLMEGSFSITPLRDGMSLHCTNIVHLRDMATQFVMPDKSVKVMLRLEGNAEVVMGTQSLNLDAGEGARARPQGCIVVLNAPDVFKRHCRAGTHQRMVVLSLGPGWFDAAGLPQDLFREHLAVHDWAPSPRAMSIAQQLIHTEGLDGPMHRLHQESRALELVIEALSERLASPPSAALTLPASAYQRVAKLQKLLDSGEADQLDMRAIALHMGCNANTLQQQFRAVCGQSIFDYLRKRRLQRAAHALRAEGVSVAEAAEIAGYSSQANFSTAFRRRFGLPPKHYRNKL
jgi:AraC-like DNA-binding protein